MNVKLFSEPWVEGFAKEAAALGLEQEETAALLKYASQLALMDNEDFAKGFQETMQKEARIGPWRHLGKALMGFVSGAKKNPWKAGLIGGGLYYGGEKLYNRIRPYFGNTLERGQLLRDIEGNYNYDDVIDRITGYQRREDEAAAVKRKRDRDESKRLDDLAGYGDNSSFYGGGWY